MPYGALYAATTHAVEGYSESLDHELRTRGIRVSVIEPAYTKTQFDANFLAPDSKLDEYRAVRALLDKVLKEVMATADEPGVVADVCAGSGHRRPPKTSLRGRRARESSAIASQICAGWIGGRRHSKGSTARRTDGVAASHPGPGKVSVFQPRAAGEQRESIHRRSLWKRRSRAGQRSSRPRKCGRMTSWPC